MSHFLHNHLISHHLHYTEINEVYISRAARAFGISLIGIFIPIYLYSSGYGLPLIALFFILANVARILTTPFAGYLLARFGAKHLMAFGQFWAIVFVGLLTFVEINVGLVVLTAVVWGIDLAVFWVPHHFNLSHVRTRGKTSRQVGMVLILLSIAHALGPLLGGIIATQFGIQYNFLLAIALLLLAGYVFLQTPGNSPKVVFNWQDIRRDWYPMRRDAFANTANSMQNDVAVMMWPLFLFLFLGTYQAVGLVVSVSLVVSIIVIYLIARQSDLGKGWQQIHLGSKSSSLVHLVRPFAQTFGMAAGINILHEVASNLYRIPFISYYYDHASSAPNRLAYIMRMEVAGASGLIAMWLVVLLLALVLPLEWALIGAFILAAVAVLFNTKIATPKTARLDVQVSPDGA